MDKTRSRTRRLQPAFGGGIAALIAAMAMAYSMAGSHNSYPDETDHAGIGLSDTGGDAHGNGGAGGGSGPGAGGASDGGGVHFLADGSHNPFGQNGESGSGDGGDDHSGFMPNGENGLMTLASYTRGGDDRGDGGGHHDSDGSSGDQHDGFPGDQQTAQNDHGPGGFGAPGGLGAPGGGGGGGGGGGKPDPNGQDPTHTDPTDQGPHDPGPNDPGPGPGGDHPFTPGDGPGGCVLGVGPACGGAPGDPDLPDFNPPKTFFGPNSDGPGGDDSPPAGHDALVADGIPEPATWLTLILGLAVLGQSLRTRRPKRLA